MSSVKFKNEEVKIGSGFPEAEKDLSDIAKNIILVKTDLEELSLDKLKGKKVLINTFPSVDTSVCANQFRKFAEKVGKLEDTILLCVSMDTPFALERFCGAEGIDNVLACSDYRDKSLDKSFGLTMTEGPLKGLYARSVIALDEDLKVIYSKLVEEVTTEPDYEEAIQAIS